MIDLLPTNNTIYCDLLILIIGCVNNLIIKIESNISRRLNLVLKNNRIEILLNSLCSEKFGYKKFCWFVQNSFRNRLKWMKWPENLFDKMQSTFGRVEYYASIIMAILANGILYLYCLDGRLFGEIFNAGSRSKESCIRFKCVNILDNAQQIPGNFLIALLLL